MFFSSELVSELQKDHQRIRDKALILADGDCLLSTRRQSLVMLIPQMHSYAAREEKIAFSILMQTPQLREFVLGRSEEHRLIEHLLAKMKIECDSVIWSAQATVLAELIDHHFALEEVELFPALKRILDVDLDRNLADQYRRKSTHEFEISDLNKEQTNFALYREL